MTDESEGQTLRLNLGTNPPLRVVAARQLGAQAMTALRAALATCPEVQAAYLVDLAVGDEALHPTVAVVVDSGVAESRRGEVAVALHDAVRPFIGNAVIDFLPIEEGGAQYRPVLGVALPFFRSPSAPDEPHQRYTTTLDQMVWEHDGLRLSRSGPVPDGDPLKEVADDLDSLIAGFSAPENVLLFRLADGDAGRAMAGRVGTVWYDNGYFDTVIIRPEMENLVRDGEWFIEIEVEAGTRMAPLFEMPDAPKEVLSQVLLRRGSRFRILGVTPHDGAQVQHMHVRVRLLSESEN